MLSAIRQRPVGMLTPLPASTVFVDKSLALIEAAAATAGRMDGRTGVPWRRRDSYSRHVRRAPRLTAAMSSTLHQCHRRSPPRRLAPARPPAVVYMSPPPPRAHVVRSFPELTRRGIRLPSCVCVCVFCRDIVLLALSSLEVHVGQSLSTFSPARRRSASAPTS